MESPTESINSSNSEKKNKRTAWTDTAEQMLVAMWENKIEQLRKNRKNQHVYAEIAAELQKNCFPLSPLQVKNKVHNLTKRYRKEKLLVCQSDGSPSQWPLYERLHCMLGSYKYYNLSETYDTILAPSTSSAAASFTHASKLGLDPICVDESAESTPSPSSSISPASPSPPIAPASPSPLIAETPTQTLRGKRNKFQQQILRQLTEVNKKIDKQIEQIQEMDEKMYNLECKKTDFLEKAVAKQTAVMDAILDYINSKK